MKLITFDEGRVGRLDGDDVIELDVASMRAYFERAGKVDETGERLLVGDVRMRAPIVPKKFFHTAGNFTAHHEELQAVDWSHPVHKGSCSSRTSTRSSVPTTRSCIRRA